MSCAIVATEQSVQTLQLNTRLSNKSWVGVFKYIFVRLPLNQFFSSSEMNSQTKKIRLLRCGNISTLHTMS